jgi:hypothetical protein
MGKVREIVDILQRCHARDSASNEHGMLAEIQHRKIVVRRRLEREGDIQHALIICDGGNEPEVGLEEKMKEGGHPTVKLKDVFAACACRKEMKDTQNILLRLASAFPGR